MLISYCYMLPLSTADWINKIENEIDKASSEQRETTLLGNLISIHCMIPRVPKLSFEHSNGH